MGVLVVGTGASASSSSGPVRFDPRDDEGDEAAPHGRGNHFWACKNGRTYSPYNSIVNSRAVLRSDTIPPSGSRQFSSDGAREREIRRFRRRSRRRRPRRPIILGAKTGLQRFVSVATAACGVVLGGAWAGAGSGVSTVSAAAASSGSPIPPIPPSSRSTEDYVGGVSRSMSEQRGSGDEEGARGSTTTSSSVSSTSSRGDPIILPGAVEDGSTIIAESNKVEELSSDEDDQAAPRRKLFIQDPEMTAKVAMWVHKSRSTASDAQVKQGSVTPHTAATPNSLKIQEPPGATGIVVRQGLVYDQIELVSSGSTDDDALGRGADANVRASLIKWSATRCDADVVSEMPSVEGCPPVSDGCGAPFDGVAKRYSQVNVPTYQSNKFDEVIFPKGGEFKICYSKDYTTNQYEIFPVKITVVGSYASDQKVWCSLKSLGQVTSKAIVGVGLEETISCNLHSDQLTGCFCRAMVQVFLFFFWVQVKSLLY